VVEAVVPDVDVGVELRFRLCHVGCGGRVGRRLLGVRLWTVSESVETVGLCALQQDVARGVFEVPGVSCEYALAASAAGKLRDRDERVGKRWGTNGVDSEVPVRREELQLSSEVACCCC
jgi:hypothetical protein